MNGYQEHIIRFIKQADVLPTNQGPEFTSRAFLARAQVRGPRHILNQAVRPTQKVNESSLRLSPSAPYDSNRTLHRSL